jgi:hypothetical protein
MKAKPLKIADGGYVPCMADEATHLQFNVPGPFPTRIIPVIRKGTRAGTGCWSWNGDTEKPTIKPSVSTTNGRNTKCHSFINDGKIQFLADSTHEFAGQTLDLLDVESE